MSVDDFRGDFEDEFDFYGEEDWQEEPAPSDTFLGMTPPQRFVIAFLTFSTVVIISVLCLLVTGRIALSI